MSKEHYKVKEEKVERICPTAPVRINQLDENAEILRDFL